MKYFDKIKKNLENWLTADAYFLENVAEDIENGSVNLEEKGMTIDDIRKHLRDGHCTIDDIRKHLRDGRCTRIVSARRGMFLGAASAMAGVLFMAAIADLIKKN